MQELKLIKRLRRIDSELRLLGVELEDRAPICEPESPSETAPLMNSGMLEMNIKRGLKDSLKSELDSIVRMQIALESRRRDLLTAIADVKHRLSESKGQKRKPLQDAMLQLRSKQRLMNYETNTLIGMHKQLLLVCRSRYCRAQKFYKDVKDIDEKSANLISFRWTQLSVDAFSASLNEVDEGSGSAENGFDSFLEKRHCDFGKNDLTTSIEQWFCDAVTATTQ
jgi:hypothetical protein